MLGFRRVAHPSPTPAGAGSVYYLYDLAGNVITELSGTGDWNRVEIYSAGNLPRQGRGHVATYSGGASGTTYFDHADWLGTERARTDAQGEMTETCTSLAFGDDLNCSGNDASPLHFTGKRRDTETGNDDFGARYYGSGAGRFMSHDEGKFDWGDPQSANRYAYARNNPLRYIDLSGNYFIVASDTLPQVRQYIATLLRSESGRQLVYQIGLSSRANYFNSGTLPRTQVSGNQVAVTNAQSAPIPGSTPGSVVGTTTTLDFNNISFTASASGQADFLTGLLAFTHDAFHVLDGNSASTFQGAVAAMAAGDAPSYPGASDTTGGTAQARALGVVSSLSSAADNYQSNATLELEAERLILYGQLQQIISNRAVGMMPTEPQIGTSLVAP
jgi:RHS repeat-associated protein